MKYLFYLFQVLVLSLLFINSPSEANTSSTDDEGWIGYESIVKELKTSEAPLPTNMNSGDPFDSILLHAGIGFATTHVFITPAGQKNVTGFLRGMEANLGIDLFSSSWIAEGSVRTFGSEELEKGQEVALQEFDLKIVYQSPLSRKLLFKANTGLAARYLNYKVARSDNPVVEEYKYSTPSGIVGLSLLSPITKSFSLGTGIGYRWALIDETIDQSAIDAHIRIDAHF